MNKRIVLCEEELIEAINNKATLGQEALYHILLGFVMVLHFQNGQNTEMAEDVLQQSFIRVFFLKCIMLKEAGYLPGCFASHEFNSGHDESKQYKYCVLKCGSVGCVNGK